MESTPEMVRASLLRSHLRPPDPLRLRARRSLGGLLAALLLWAGACSPSPATDADASPAPLLVGPEWLEERLGEEDLVILHVGSDSSFAAGHIPGARPMALQRFAPEVDGLGTEMPDPASFRELLEEAGISAHSRIVVYTVTHPPQFAARLYLTLEHFGLGARSSILDGGLRAWEAEGRPVSTDSAEPARGVLPDLAPGGGVLVDHAYVADRVLDAGVRVVDARDAPFWTGEQQLQVRSERPGRIPGALNVPFRSLVDEAGHFLAEDRLRALFSEAGVQPGDPVIAYCHVGQQASLLAVAARLLGHPVHLYDGSWEDWSRRAELPAETDQD
jgi:thiosulfate/3-mercaptopyruvate sulfurtransferase